VLLKQTKDRYFFEYVLMSLCFDTPGKFRNLNKAGQKVGENFL